MSISENNNNIEPTRSQSNLEETPKARHYGKLSNKVCPEGMTIEEWQIGLRRETAIEAQFEVEHLDQNRIWGDYIVSGKMGRYRVAFRGVLSDRNYCSCLDFRTNGLGTCKHIESVALFLAEEVPGYPWANLTYAPPYTSIYVSYKGGRSIRIRIGETQQKSFIAIRDRYFDKEGKLPEKRYDQLEDICQQCISLDPEFRCYDDVFDFAREVIDRQEWERTIEAAYPARLLTDGPVGLQGELLQRKAYAMIHKGYGLIANISNDYAVVEVISLGLAILSLYPKGRRGYIVIAGSPSERAHWQTALSSLGEETAISIVTPQEFVRIDFSKQEHPTSFVYIDDADVLKEWRNSLSIVLKGLKIGHLYMRVATLTTLTPVQVSSILQHISPYTIGPFYRFIHTYRPIFPLLDDGSNMPIEIKDIVFLPNEIDLHQTFVSPSPIDNDRNETPGDKATATPASQKLQNLFSALEAVIDDQEALRELKNIAKRFTKE